MAPETSLGPHLKRKRPSSHLCSGALLPVSALFSLTVRAPCLSHAAPFFFEILHLFSFPLHRLAIFFN